MALTTGQVLHQRYRIVALLGQGGMGDVYRAWDLSLKMTVAVKESLELNGEAQEQFGEEARLLARLAHPNLPRVIDYFAVPGQAEYLVMDYIEGEDLESLLDQAGEGLPEAQILPWINQVCDALSYLHNQAQPVIHRDVKPGNIKITPDGRAVLVDFGIAKRYDPGRGTLAGARAVTPGYSPPEQYGGASTDPRSDIYALGATLYHLLTGQTPPESVQRAAGAAPALAPRQVNPLISLGTEQAILKAMAPAMDARYQQAKQLKAALAEAGRSHVNQPASAKPAMAVPAASIGSAKPAASIHLAPRPAPIPVEPLPRRTTTAPPPAPTFLAANWPLLLLSGILAVILLLALIRQGINQQAERAAQQTLVPNPTPLRPTATSPIDSLVAKSAATQTAAAGTSQTPLAFTPAATPVLPAYPRRLYDPFKDNTNQWLTGIEGSLACWLAGGRYTCQTQAEQAANRFQWLDSVSLPAEFTLSAEIWPGPDRPRGLGDSNAGLVFRSTEQGRYVFSIRNDGYFRVSSIQSAPANWIDLIAWQPSPAIRRGEDNRLSVAGRGYHYDLFINGQFVASIDDNQWPEGAPGLHLFTAPGEKPAVVEFDNFELHYP